MWFLRLGRFCRGLGYVACVVILLVAIGFAWRDNLEGEVVKWTVVCLGAFSASLGLASRYPMSERGRDFCAIATYVTAGLALIMTQA